MRKQKIILHTIGWQGSIALASLLLLCQLAWGAPETTLAAPPQQLVFLGVHGNSDPVSVVMNNITYTSQAPDNLAGTGSVVIRVGSTTLPPIPNVPFSHVSVDSSGRANGLTYVFNNEQDVPNIFGSGVGLSIGIGTKLAFVLQPTPSLQLSGGAFAAILPFRDSNGNAPKLQLQSTVSLSENGEITIDAQNASLTKDTSAGGIKLPGCTVQASPMNLHYHHYASGSNKPDEFTLTIPSATIAVNLPDIVTQDEAPLTLDAQNVSIDQDGLVSFNASLNNANIYIPLAQPMGFGLTVTSAQFSMKNSQPQTVSLTCDITLPPSLSTTNNTSATIPNVKLSYNFANAMLPEDRAVALNRHIGTSNCGVGGDNLFASVQLPQEIDLTWNGLGLTLPTGSTVVVDFSSTKGDPAEKDPATGQPLPASWRGIFIQQATLTLPSAFQNNGQPAKVQVQNFYIDQNGVSGAVSLNNVNVDKVGSVNITLNDLAFDIGHNRIQDCRFDGNMKLPSLGGNLGLSGSFSNTGDVSLAIEADQTIQSQDFPCSLHISQGKVEKQPNDKWIFALTGQIQFNGNASVLSNATLDLTDLEVGSDGHFQLGGAWLNLNNPYDISLGPAELEIRQLGFGTDQQKGMWIGLTGNVKLSGDLPISVQGNFDGIKFYQHGPPSLGSIAVDCEIQHLVHVSGQVDFHKPDPPHGYNDSYLDGQVSLTLECLGSGTGFQAEFLVAKHAWFVGAGIQLPQPIPLGSSGLGLGGFMGAIGHNVKSANGVTSGIPKVDQLVPLSDQEIANGQTSWIFCAGIRLETMDQNTFWGDFTLTVSTNPLVIDLHGNGYLLDPVDNNHIPADPSKHDRVLIGDIYINPSAATFQASLAADINIPSRDHKIIHAGGQIVLHIDPNTQYLHLGGPIHADVGQYQLQIDNPIEIDLLNFASVKAAVDIDHTNDSFSFAAALDVEAGFHSSGSVGWGITLDYDVSASAYFKAYVSIGYNNGLTFGGFVAAGASASIELSAHIVFATVSAGLSAYLNGALGIQYQNDQLTASGDLNAGVSVDLPGVGTVGGNLDVGYTFTF
ncbi:hypothetical protein CTKA_02610 [Chthonomonas calidirosea]|uniref:Uncharacterized protein n=1 Tax=Chthonomonas calidirosea (strain DSM 23976 / ICMP 18418 / T49) TaxID=1303518 RepID=S0EYA9_CHTCT|nr:hypothetical protein [Chthonomonas calidirosea]CCW35305.1 hypothetical protein CCALI_01489 [Chthonomonas calidirosea T49]CEK20658.1 hypothetical protein CTKA_02610 [Chthonomonas calidirosea]